MKKLLIFTLMIALTFSVVGCDELEVTGERLGVAYFNAHGGTIAAAGAVVDADGKIIAAYLDDLYMVDLNAGNVGLPGVNDAKFMPNVKDVSKTLASKRNKVNSDIYGASMAAKAGSTVLPADNLTKIQQFAIGKTIAELEAIIAKDNAKDEIQAASGATFADNAPYLNTIVLAAKNAKKSSDVFNVANPANVELKQAYYYAHGGGITNAYALVEGNKIVKSFVDEIYFWGTDGANVVFSLEGAKGDKLVGDLMDGKMLGSKKFNLDANGNGIYGATMKNGAWLKQITAVEKFIDGKGVNELTQAFEKLSAADAKVADLVSGSTMSDTKNYIKAVAIAADPSLANGDTRAQAVSEVGIAKLGLGVSITDGKSTDATETAGAKGRVDVYVAAVALDKNGKIVKSTLDAFVPQVVFDKDMKIASELSEIKSKIVQGEAYGMKVASKIGKEWNEQAAGFEAWAVGKTLADIKGADNKADADLAATISVSLGNIIEAYENAINNAVAVEKQGASKLGFGYTAKHTSTSLNVEAKTNAVAGFDITLAASLLTNNGKVVATTLDEMQLKVNFDEKGKKSGTQLKTKLQLGDAGYPMHTGSKVLGLGWGDQAKGFASKLVGKNANDIKAIELDGGKAVDADLLSAATMTVSGLIETVLNSYNNVK